MCVCGGTFIAAIALGSTTVVDFVADDANIDVFVFNVESGLRLLDDDDDDDGQCLLASSF